MRTNARILFGALALAVTAVPAHAQLAQLEVDADQPRATSTRDSADEASATPQIVIQNKRPADQRGVHVFEPPKNDGVPFDGFRLEWGAAFAQQFQALSHENGAASNMVDGVDQNQLIDIGSGFNNAAANLDLNAQLAPGIRVSLTTYLSARHHPEAWVKDGYLLIDASPLEVELLERVMEYVTLKAGHFEIDYGDAHYRRTDNGNAIHNPFVGNLVMDAFTTQIGAHVYVRPGPFIAMAGVTNGEIKGDVTNPARRAPAWLGKLGFDSQLSEDLRLRLTGSLFTQNRAVNNTLYGGDRAGSRYYLVMENTAASVASQAWSGNINPGFRSEVDAWMINPFVKYRGLEFFGTYERSEGRAASEDAKRAWTQYAGDVVYRFLADEQLYVAGRYNLAEGELAGMANEVSVDRVQLGAGWYVTPNLLLKGEYVTQKYNDFPAADIRSGGEFNGFIMEGVVAF